jgi:prevent-host-death family protein
MHAAKTEIHRARMSARHAQSPALASIGIAEAKTRLSELVEQAASGEEIVIARDHKPVAKLVPVRRHAPRVPGSAKGQVWIAPDFDEIPDDFHDYTR